MIPVPKINTKDPDLIKKLNELPVNEPKRMSFSQYSAY